MAAHTDNKHGVKRAHDQITVSSQQHLDRAKDLFSKKKPVKDIILELTLYCLDRFKSTIVSLNEIDPMKVIQVYRELNELVLDQFRNHQSYHLMIQSACSLTIQQYEGELSKKVLDRFCTAIMDQKTDTQSLYQLTQGMCWIYGALADVDVFEYGYRWRLMERLVDIPMAVVSLDTERDVLDKLCNSRSDGGGGFKTKPLRMIQEVVDPKLKIQSGVVNAIVCTGGVWPDRNNTYLMPVDVSVDGETLTQKYKQDHPTHRLTWSATHGYADITIQFSDSGPVKEYTVSTIQMILLLLFNQRKVWTFEQILTHTRLPRNIISGPLLALCHPKVAMIHKTPPTCDLSHGTQFKLNPLGCADDVKHIPRDCQRKTSDSDSTGFQSWTRTQCDESILRVAKHFHIIQHAELVERVVERLSKQKVPEWYRALSIGDTLRVRPRDIRKRIEHAIENEILRRDETNRTLYHYVA